MECVQSPVTMMMPLPLLSDCDSRCAAVVKSLVFFRERVQGSFVSFLSFSYFVVAFGGPVSFLFRSFSSVAFVCGGHVTPYLSSLPGLS